MSTDKKKEEKPQKPQGPVTNSDPLPPCPEGQERNSAGECVKKGTGNDTHP